MKTEICKYLAENISGSSYEEWMQLVEIPPDEKMGNYAFPCFALAKKMRKNPAMIANELKEVLSHQLEVLGMEKVGPTVIST